MTDEITDVTDLYYRAHEARKRRDFAPALALYFQFLDGFPAGAKNNTVRKAMLGALECAKSIGAGTRMEKLARRAVDAFPYDARASLFLGEALIHLKRRAEAEGPLARAIELDPGLVEARVLLGVLRKPPRPARQTARRLRPWPARQDRFDNLPQLIRKYLLSEEPTGLSITDDTVFMTLGSCFASNLARRLGDAGHTVHHEPIGEEVNTTYANRYLLEWIEHGPHSGPTAVMEGVYGPAVRDRLRTSVAQSDVFVLTLGVAPCFFDEETGDFAFSWSRSSVGRSFLTHDYVMRTTTVAENVDNVNCLIESVRRLSKGSPHIVLTVSPVALSGTTEFSSAITADCISKSTLRLACHEVLSGRPGENVHYWPSFEIVRWLGAHLGAAHPPVYGAEDGNTRHVSAWLVDVIVDLFLEHHRAPVEPR